MSNLAKKDEKAVEYVPAGSDSAIKLSASMVSNFIAVPTKSGALPTERDCIRFVLLCKARALNPFEGDAYLIGYDGRNGPEFSLITAHQAFMKRAQLSKEYNGMESGVGIIDADGKFVERAGDLVFEGETLVSAWARVYFKTLQVPMFKRLKRTTFDTGKSRWEKDPAGMLVKCAEADALRSSFPTTCGDLYIQPEMDHVVSKGETWAPVEMPVEIPAESTMAAPEAPPETPGNRGKSQETHEKGSNSGETMWATGTITAISEKKSKPDAKKQWTCWGVKVDGEFHNTFDEKLAGQAIALKDQGKVVDLEYKVDGKYRNIVSIKEFERNGEDTVFDENGEPIRS